MMRKIKVRYGCGYGMHEDVIEVEDLASDGDIARTVGRAVMSEMSLN